MLAAMHSKTKHLALLNKAVGKRGCRNDLADQLLAPRSTDETGGSVATLSLLCRFSDAGMRRLSTRCGGRRPKSAKARNRGKWGCACRKLNPGILVMQPAQDWAAKNVPGAIDGAREGCILLQG